MRATLTRLHQLLAKSAFLARICVRVRNQATCVISWYLGEASDGNKNGEYRVLETLLPYCTTFVDVGANVGNWSEYLLTRRQIQGVLYEPSRACFGVLERRFAGRSVRLRNVAVGNQLGTVSFVE